MGDTPSKPEIPYKSTKSNYSLDDCAKCVKEFSASKEEYVGGFIEQVLAVQKTFGVRETDLKLLIIRKLSGAAEEWFQSKPSHITMSSQQILEELERVYGNRSRLASLQQNFLNRKWRWREHEKFFDYYQEKVNLGSNFNLPEEILVQRIISGIDNPEWERQLIAAQIEKTSVLLEKMENAISDYMIKNSKQAKSNACIYCKKDNHPSEKCHFKNVKPEPCKYCKKIGHSPEKCFFKPDGTADANKTDSNPCKYCSKTGHRSENCYFKSCELPDPDETLKNSIASGSSTETNTKRTKSESNDTQVKNLTKDLNDTMISEKNKRWRSKSESKQNLNNTKSKNIPKNKKANDKKEHLLFMNE